MTRTDRIIILLCLALAAGFFVVPSIAARSARPKMVQIEVKGRIMKRVRLLPPGQSGKIYVPLSRGQAVISLENGGARILPMPGALCPKGICSHAGAIRRGGQVLVCAPNALVVRVIDNQNRVHAVAR